MLSKKQEDTGMDAVYRVWGANLGDGTCTTASSEEEAIEIVSAVFGLKKADLKTAIDKSVGPMMRGIVLKGSGETFTVERS